MRVTPDEEPSHRGLTAEVVSLCGEGERRKVMLAALEVTSADVENG